MPLNEMPLKRDSKTLSPSSKIT